MNGMEAVLWIASVCVGLRKTQGTYRVPIVFTSPRIATLAARHVFGRSLAGLAPQVPHDFSQGRGQVLCRQRTTAYESH